MLRSDNNTYCYFWHMINYNWNVLYFVYNIDIYIINFICSIFVLLPIFQQYSHCHATCHSLTKLSVKRLRISVAFKLALLDWVDDGLKLKNVCVGTMSLRHCPCMNSPVIPQQNEWCCAATNHQFFLIFFIFLFFFLFFFFSLLTRTIP